MQENIFIKIQLNNHAKPTVEIVKEIYLIKITQLGIYTIISTPC